METKIDLTKEFRKVNGFRVLLVVVDGALPVYAIKPNGTSLTFYFKDFYRASYFAQHYQNAHGDAFWFRRWSTVHSLPYVVKLNSPDVIPY